MGTPISFWIDSWCHESPLVELLDPSPSVLDRSQVKVNEFITPENSCDTVKLSQFLP